MKTSSPSATRACLWLRVSTDNKGQDPQLQRADLERVCQQRGWQIVQVYEVAESAFGKRPREQFQRLMQDARRGVFDVLVVWSMDRFSREPVFDVLRSILALHDYHVRFFSLSEDIIDTTTPFGPAILSLFAALAHLDSKKKGERVKLGMEKARANGANIGRPELRVDADLVLRLRDQGKRWREIQSQHPRIRLAPRRYGPPSERSLRRAYDSRHKGAAVAMPETVAV